MTQEDTQVISQTRAEAHGYLASLQSLTFVGKTGLFINHLEISSSTSREQRPSESFYAAGGPRPAAAGMFSASQALHPLSGSLDPDQPAAAAAMEELCCRHGSEDIFPASFSNKAPPTSRSYSAWGSPALPRGGMDGSVAPSGQQRDKNFITGAEGKNPSLQCEDSEQGTAALGANGELATARDVAFSMRDWPVVKTFL